MQLTESSIFINLKKLRERLYGAQFHMNKADRIIYGTPLMEASGQSIGEFVLAFLLNGEKKLEHLECSIAWFTRLRIDLEFCVSENIIKFKKREEKLDSNGNPIPALIEVDNLGMEKRLPEDTADNPQGPFECDSNYSISTANLVRKLSE